VTSGSGALSPGNDLLAAHLRGLRDLGEVPRARIHDSEKAIVAWRRRP
jgi:hypothetical protein